MNKTSLVSGTIKGIQIVDLSLKQNNQKNSSKKYVIKLKKNKNSSNNNSITNDSLISIKENISNKNTSISSKPKQQTTSISSNQKPRKIKNQNNISNNSNQINKNMNKNFIKIKLNQKNNNLLPRPVQKQKYIFNNHNNETKVIKKLLSHSKGKKPNTQGNIIRNTFNNKIQDENININSNLNVSGNSNSNLNININTSKLDFFLSKEKIKSEPNTKRQIFPENSDFFIPKIKNREILTKEQKRKIKIVFKKILTMNSDVDSFIRSSRHNLEINSSVDSINYRKINKENFGKNNLGNKNNININCNNDDKKIIKKIRTKTNRAKRFKRYHNLNFNKLNRKTSCNSTPIRNP